MHIKVFVVEIFYWIYKIYYRKFHLERIVMDNFQGKKICNRYFSTQKNVSNLLSNFCYRFVIENFLYEKLLLSKSLYIRKFVFENFTYKKLSYQQFSILENFLSKIFHIRKFVIENFLLKIFYDENLLSNIYCLR